MNAQLRYWKMTHCLEPTDSSGGRRFVSGFVTYLRRLVACLLLTFSVGELLSTAVCIAADLDQPGYLLIDPRIVQSVDNVQLQLGKVNKSSANPLFKEEKPWEVRYDNVYANVVYDDEEKQFKCWYSPFIVDECTTNTPTEARAATKYHVTPKREMGLCYAYSSDGINWIKPELGIVEWNGNKQNNILLRCVHGSSVIDQGAESNPSMRYKLFAGSEVPGQKRFMITSTSPDGIHWAKPQPCLEIESTGDTHNNAVWCPEARRFVGFTREFIDERMVMRTESADFKNWSKAVEVLRGTPLQQTYAMQVFSCRGIYLGMLAILDTQTDRVHGELAVSANTVDWTRVCDGTPLVPNSDASGEYDYGCVYIAKSPIAIDEEVRIYYGASNAPHGGWRKGSLALATLKRDRWAGYMHSQKEPAESPGIVRTAPIMCRGAKLRANILAPQGAVRVGVVGQEQLSIERCTALSGDAGNAAVEWQSDADMSGLVGTPIQLEFQIEVGVLYAFEFVE